MWARLFKTRGVEFTLNRLFAVVFVTGSCTLVLVSYTLFRQQQTALLKEWQATTVQRSWATTSSYYGNIVARLISGNKQEVDAILEEQKAIEGLLSIAIVPALKITAEIFRTCETNEGHSTYQIPTCYEATNDSFRVYHELRSAGYTVGFLLKQFARPQMRILAKNILVANTAIVVSCFLLVTCLSLICLRRYLIRPIHCLVSNALNLE